MNFTEIFLREFQKRISRTLIDFAFRLLYLPVTLGASSRNIVEVTTTLLRICEVPSCSVGQGLAVLSFINCRQTVGWCLKVDHDCLLSYHLQIRSFPVI